VRILPKTKPSQTKTMQTTGEGHKDRMIRILSQPEASAYFSYIGEAAREIVFTGSVGYSYDETKEINEAVRWLASEFVELTMQTLCQAGLNTTDRLFVRGTAWQMNELAKKGRIGIGSGKVGCLEPITVWELEPRTEEGRELQMTRRFTAAEHFHQLTGQANALLQLVARRQQLLAEAESQA
jgi:hypothetical protein